MSLNRLEAPKKHLPVNRDNACRLLGFAAPTSNQNIVQIQGRDATVNANQNLPDRASVIDSDGNGTLQEWIGGDAPTFREEHTCMLNPSVRFGMQTLPFANVTLVGQSGANNFFFGGVIQVGAYADEGGVTITVTLPTQAECLLKMCNRDRPGGGGTQGEMAQFRVIQAATNAADQINFATADLTVKFNGGGQTGTTQYDVYFDVTPVDTVNVTILNV
jgi:hypothetical protein